MRVTTVLALVVCLLSADGCGKQKSTNELIQDLESSPVERDRIAAVRLLPRRKEDAAQVVPVLIEALQSKDSDIRWSAAIGLGTFHEKAQDAIPALQTIQKEDRDARVREGAGIALTRIDPTRFTYPMTTSKSPGEQQGQKP